MKKTMLIAAIAAPALLLAAETETVVTNRVIDLSKCTPEEAREAVLMCEGGDIANPKTKKGKITYVNAQKRIPREWLGESIILFNNCFWGHLRFDIQVKDGAFTLPSPKLETEANLFIIDDPAMPTILSAPENRWVMVNMSGIEEGRGEKPQFLHARALKRMMRGICILAGAQDSTYPRCLLTCMTKAEQLDVNPDCRMPVDVIRRFEKYLKGYGILPERIVTYRQACEEGWAPQPTNKYQKAVWDDVHFVPTEPVKIKFDKKRDAGK